MGLLTPCFVPGEGFLYTIIVPGGGFLLPSSRVPGVCPGGGMVLDEIDTCISIRKSYFWFPRLSSVTMATSLSGGIRDFLKLPFYMFPYNETLKAFKSKI